MKTTKRNNGISLVDYRTSGVIDKIKLIGKSLLGIVDTAGEVILAGSEVVQGVVNHPMNKIVDKTNGDIQQYTQDKIDAGTSWIIDQFVPNEESEEKSKEEVVNKSKEDKIKELLSKLDESKLDALLKTLES